VLVRNAPSSHKVAVGVALFVLAGVGGVPLWLRSRRAVALLALIPAGQLSRAEQKDSLGFDLVRHDGEATTRGQLAPSSSVSGPAV
jgi:hypothetical protein